MFDEYPCQWLARHTATFPFECDAFCFKGSRIYAILSMMFELPQYISVLVLARIPYYAVCH